MNPYAPFRADYARLCLIIVCEPDPIFAGRARHHCYHEDQHLGAWETEPQVRREPGGDGWDATLPDGREMHVAGVIYEPGGCSCVGRYLGEPCDCGWNTRARKAVQPPKRLQTPKTATKRPVGDVTRVSGAVFSATLPGLE